MNPNNQDCTAEEVIQLLDLVPLPEEGGFYRETYRANIFLQSDHGKRCTTTCIYYLVTPEEFSALHKVKSVEIFHFYAGDPVEMVRFRDESDLEHLTLGQDLKKGQTPQVIVEPNTWQGTRLKPGGRWALLGCTVSPGFEFEDFEIWSRQQLIEAFPKLADSILPLTR